MPKLLVFVGSLNREAPYFQGARGKGISVWSFDEDSLLLEKLTETDEVDNPTFLSVSPDGGRIYANAEIFTWREGTVTAYAYDREASRIDYLNKQATLGSVTAHNWLTADGRHLLVSNYGMGSGGPDQSVVVFGIREDGGLTVPLDSVRLEGTGPNEVRQERAHAHSATESRVGKVVIIADLGIDALVTYRLLPDGQLEPLAETALKPGAGPRHLALHPEGKFVFVMNELDSTVVSLALDPETGNFTFVDAKPAVPADARERNHCADIQISPDGRFVYGSNRGHDSISIFAVDQETGRLTPVGFTPCGGSTPRNLCLTPSGDHLFCANQNADRVTIFARDAVTGLLADTGTAIEVGTPMCVKIVE